MACQQDNQSDTTHLYQRITQLENRVDSLVKVLGDIQTLKAEAPVKKTRTKPVKKAKELANTSAPSLQPLQVRPVTTTNNDTRSSLSYSSSQCMGTTKKAVAVSEQFVEVAIVGRMEDSLK